jgi:hypothetical protein
MRNPKYRIGINLLRRESADTSQANGGLSAIAVFLTGMLIAKDKDAAHSGVWRRRAWRRKSGFASPRLSK